MKNNRIILTLALLSFSLLLAAQKAHTQFVEKAGTLISYFTEAEANGITSLTLTGKINAIDFKHLRNEFKNLEELDLSNVEIRLYAGNDGTYPDKFYVYPTNCIPAHALKGKQTLRKIVLSEKIKNIEDEAFKGCTSLSICQIQKKKAPNLMKEALTDSLTAVFVPIGCSDSYRQSKQWDTYSIIEGTPVKATVQVGMMGTLEEEIIKSGIQPGSINYLTIEGKLDAADFKLIRNYMHNLVSVDLSKTNATHIPEFTFTQKKYLLNIKLPHALKSIGERAFSSCKRICGSIELPATVTSLGYGAFLGCDNLRHVIVTGNKLTAVGDHVFGTDGEMKLIYQK